MEATGKLASLLDTVQFYKDELNLHHWRIEVSTIPAAHGTFFQIVTTRPRNHAAIRYTEEGLRHPQMAKLIAHELLHLIFEPVREEHDFQMAALATDRQQEYSERMLRVIEKAVEHLSHVV